MRPVPALGFQFVPVLPVLSCLSKDIFPGRQRLAVLTPTSQHPALVWPPSPLGLLWTQASSAAPGGRWLGAPPTLLSGALVPGDGLWLEGSWHFFFFFWLSCLRAEISVGTGSTCLSLGLCLQMGTRPSPRWQHRWSRVRAVTGLPPPRARSPRLHRPCPSPRRPRTPPARRAVGGRGQRGDDVLAGHTGLLPLPPVLRRLRPWPPSTHMRSGGSPACTHGLPPALRQGLGYGQGGASSI